MKIQRKIIFALCVMLSATFFTATTRGADTEGTKTDVKGKKRSEKVLDVKSEEAQFNPVLLTHYVQPLKYTDEEVTVGAYVTDWDQSEYRKGDASHTFDVTIVYGSEKDPEAHKLEQKDVPAGDVVFNLGKLEEADYQISFECVDKQGRHSPTIFHEFIVRDRQNFAITPGQSWDVTEADLKKFGINANGEYGKFIFIEPGKDLAENKVRVAKAAETIKAESRHYVVVSTGEKYEPIKYDNPRDEARGAHGTPQPDFIPTQWAWQSCKVIYADDYDAKAVENESSLNGDRINRLLDTAYRKGFRKVTFPKGYYRISNSAPIEIPSGMTVDFNGSTIKLNQFAGCHGVIIKMQHCCNSHVVNATVEGDYFEHDYEHSDNKSEWVCGIEMCGDCRYSSYERILVRYITGYGVTSGMTMDTFGKTTTVHGLERGIINAKTGKLNSDCPWALTSEMTDISEFYIDGGYVTISKYLGYQGLIGDEWNVLYSFYDSGHKFIKSIEGLQYRRVRIPDGANYMRVSVRCRKGPETLSDNYSVYLFRLPWNSWMKDIFILSARCVGMAPSAMYNHRIENCTFMRSGENLAKCAFDAEDGWDMMQDVYMVRNRFLKNPLNDLLTCAGYNFMIEDNEGAIHFWDRTKSFTVRNNKFTNANYMSKNRRRSLTSRVEGNTYSQRLTFGTDEEKKVENISNNPDVAAANAKIKDSAGKAPQTFANTLKLPEWYLVVKDVKNAPVINCKSTGVILGEKLTGGTFGKVNMVNCELSNAEVAFGGSLFKGCKLKGLKGNINGQALFEDCEVSDIESTIQKQEEIIFRNCEISNVTLKYGYWMLPGHVTFINCKIKNTGKPLIDTPAYSIGTFQFINCTFEMGKAPVVKIYDMRAQKTDSETGVVSFLNCQVNTVNLPAVHIDGRSRDSKKPLFVYSCNKSKFSAIPLDKDRPVCWLVRNTAFKSSMEIFEKEGLNKRQTSKRKF